MTLLSSNTTASDDSSLIPERVKEPPIRPRSTGSAGDASEAKHLRPSLAPAHLGTDHRDYNLATLTVLVQGFYTGGWSVVIFCKAFLKCSTCCWAETAATVQPMGREICKFKTGSL